MSEPLLELISKFNEDLLQGAETFSMTSRGQKIKHILLINIRFTVDRKMVMFVHSYT